MFVGVTCWKHVGAPVLISQCNEWALGFETERGMVRSHLLHLLFLRSSSPRDRSSWNPRRWRQPLWVTINLCWGRMDACLRGAVDMASAWYLSMALCCYGSLMIQAN